MDPRSPHSLDLGLKRKYKHTCTFWAGGRIKAKGRGTMNDKEAMAEGLGL